MERLKSIWMVVGLLGFCLILSPGHADSQVVLRWAEGTAQASPEKDWVEWTSREIEKRTHGRVKAKVFWGGSLAKLMEMPEAVSTGVADIGWVIDSYHPRFTRLGGFLQNTFLFNPTSDLEGLTKKILELYDMTPAFNEEYKKKNMIIFAHKLYDFFWLFSNKSVQTLSDLKGLKLRCSGDLQNVVFEAAGASPLFLPISETYSALQKGMVDGAAFPIQTSMQYRLNEVTKYVTKLGLSATFAQWAMNLNTFRKLSPEDQKTILQIGKEASVMQSGLMMKEREVGINFYKKSGSQFFDFAETDKATWAKMPPVLNFRNKWISELEGKGLPAGRVVDSFEKLIK